MWNIDKKIKIKIADEEAIVNIVYDKKLKKIKREIFYGFEGEAFLRVPVDKTDEEIEKYLNNPTLKNWYFGNQNTIKGSNESFEKKSQSLEKPLEERSEEELKQIIDKYVNKFTPQFGRPKQIIIRPIYTVWGRCSKSKDKLTFNPVMKYLPEEYIEHLVYHEMIHTYCLNHNPPFQREMEKRYPNWREYQRKLKVYYYKIMKEKNIWF